MTRLASLILFGFCVGTVVGCGGVAEKPAATSTPKIDPDKVQKEKEKMYEMMKGKKKAPPPKTEGATTDGAKADGAKTDKK